MSHFLAIDTSTSALSVAIKTPDTVYLKHEVVPRAHGRLILEWIEQLLAQAQLHKSELDAIFVGIGPGGFTGIRIGVGVAQGIAAALGVPMVGVSSLQSMAQFAADHYQSNQIMVAQDAKMGEVYWAAYHRDQQGELVAMVPDELRKPDQVTLPDRDGQWLAVGDAWQVYHDVLLGRVSGLDVHIQADIYPHAESLLLLGERLFANEQTMPPEQVLPVYLRGENAWKKIGDQND